jgi:murein DD-endopeptidase MepM/ murein hydrolase activator NlpD
MKHDTKVHQKMKKIKAHIQTHLPKGNKLKLMALAFFAPALLMLGFSGVPSALAESLSELRDRSAELEAKIEQNKKQAEALQQQGDQLQAAVDALDNDIARINNEIDLINTKIAELDLELKQAQEELERQKELLRANMRALYKRGGASTVELLVASDSFSEFIDEQEYLERLKTSIQNSAEQVVELEQQIRAQRDEQKKLLGQKESSKRELANTRANRASLLQKTRGQEARYREIVEDLKQQKAEAEAALARALHSGSYKAAPVGPVAAGDIVGGVGSTGLSSGPHLHLEVRTGGGTTNPSPYIKAPPVAQPPGWISQTYGNPDPIYLSGYHPGIDYAAPQDTPIMAIDDGYMYRGCSNDVLGTSNNAYGYVAIVEHSNGALSIYAHMSGGPAACNYNTYW